MIYISLIVSELPVLPVLTADQMVYVQTQMVVTEGAKKFTEMELGAYLQPLVYVIEEDLKTMEEIKSTPQLALGDAPGGDAPSIDGLK